MNPEVHVNNWYIHKNSVPNTQKTQCVSITKTNALTLFRGNSNTVGLNSQCRKNAKRNTCNNVKAGGEYSNFKVTDRHI